MPSFYGLILQKNKDNAENMSQATHAILKHYSRTTEHPKYDDCLEGVKPWRSY